MRVSTVEINQNSVQQRGVGNARYNDNRGGGAATIGGVENSSFLCTCICYIFMWTVMLLMHALMNSGSVEYTS